MLKHTKLPEHVKLCGFRLHPPQQLSTTQPRLQHTFGHQLVPLEDAYFQIRLHLPVTSSEVHLKVQRWFLSGTTLRGKFVTAKWSQMVTDALLNHALWALQSRHQTVESLLGTSHCWLISDSQA